MESSNNIKKTHRKKEKMILLLVVTRGKGGNVEEDGQKVQTPRYKIRNTSYVMCSVKTLANTAL